MDNTQQLPAEVTSQIKRDAVNADVKNQNKSWEYRAGYRGGHEDCATEYAMKLQQAEQENAALKAKCDRYEKALKEIRYVHKSSDSSAAWQLNQAQNIAIEALNEGEEGLLICPCCGGDGKETCTNPDHGFINAVGGETQRLGCPVCGHDPNHKVKSGGPCETCNGTGKVNKNQFNSFWNETGYSSEPIPTNQKEDKQ